MEYICVKGTRDNNQVNLLLINVENMFVSDSEHAHVCTSIVICHDVLAHMASSAQTQTRLCVHTGVNVSYLCVTV